MEFQLSVVYSKLLVISW